MYVEVLLNLLSVAYTEIKRCIVKWSEVLWYGAEGCRFEGIRGLPHENFEFKYGCCCFQVSNISAFQQISAIFII